MIAITNFKITPLPREGKQFWIECFIQEADPNDIAVVGLTQGSKAIVDKQYEKLVTQHRWFAAKTKASVYAKSSSVIRTVKPQTKVSLHNFIVWQYLHGRFDPTLKHTTFNSKHPLDCKMANLLSGNDRRAVMRNGKGKRDTMSKYKGVRKMAEKYRAFIYDGETNINLGTWEDEKTQR